MVNTRNAKNNHRWTLSSSQTDLLFSAEHVKYAELHSELLVIQFFFATVPMSME